MGLVAMQIKALRNDSNFSAEGQSEAPCQPGALRMRVPCLLVNPPLRLVILV